MGELQTVWGVLPSAYLFLAGAAAGTFFVSAVAVLAVPRRYGRVVNAGFLTALVLLGVGLLCLVAETEKPLRALLLPISFTNTGSWMTIGALLLPISFTNMGSWMTIGAWLLLVTMAVYAAAGVLSLPRFRAGDAVRALAAVGAVLSVGVAAYSAVLLMAAGSVPLWNDPVLIAVFLASAASMGVAIVSALLRVLGSRDPFALRVALMAAPLVELAVIAAFLAATSAGDATQQRSFELIATGPLAALFWAGAIVVGIVVPAVLAIAENLAERFRQSKPGAGADGDARGGGPSRAGQAIAVAACVCALAGAFSLRYVIVSAGIHASLIVPIATAAAAGLTL